MGTTETMTVHKALSELKILDSRIERAIAENIICVANKHSNEKINGIPLDEYKTLIQSRYDKACDLIERRKAIKRAVVLSNAVTKVKIADVEYTVAEAIEMKNHGINHDRLLMDCMQQRYDKSQATILRENGTDLEIRADEYVTGLYGNKDGKTNTDDIEKVKSDFLKANSYDLIDPLNVLEKIDILEKNISDFMTEVDSALSTSNALTTITIEY